MTTVKCSEICKTRDPKFSLYIHDFVHQNLCWLHSCNYWNKRMYAVGSVRWEVTSITSGFPISPMITHIQNFKKEEGPTYLNHSCDHIYVSTTIKCICHYILYVTYISLYDMFSIISFHLRCICFGCRSYGLRVKGTLWVFFWSFLSQSS